MKKLILIFLFFSPLFTTESYGWEFSGEKLYYKTTKIATLSDYNIEEVQEIPSGVIFIVNGKKVDLVADAEDIEKWLKGKKGKKFRITYGKVRGWLGDGVEDYEVLMDAKPIK